MLNYNVNVRVGNIERARYLYKDVNKIHIINLLNIVRQERHTKDLYKGDIVINKVYENNGVVVEEEIYRDKYVAPTAYTKPTTIAQYMYEVAGTLD